METTVVGNTNVIFQRSDREIRDFLEGWGEQEEDGISEIAGGE